MRTDNRKIKLTISFPVDKPDINGCVYTKEAIENAVCNLHTGLPIVYEDDECHERIIGATTGNSHIVTWDSENQVCKVTVEGVVFDSGATIVINGIKDSKITDFEIVGMWLSK